MYGGGTIGILASAHQQRSVQKDKPLELFYDFVIVTVVSKRPCLCRKDAKPSNVKLRVIHGKTVDEKCMIFLQENQELNPAKSSLNCKN